MLRQMLAVLALPLLALPALAAPLQLERDGSEIGFEVKQMGVRVSGTFERFAARVDWEEAQPEKSSALFTVQVDSLSTGDATTDETARAPLWLDTTKYPQAQFESSRLRRVGEGRYEATGTLTLKGRRQTVVVPFTRQRLPDGRVLLRGALTLQRAAYGIGGGEWDSLVAAEVPIRFQLRLAPTAP